MADLKLALAKFSALCAKHRDLLVHCPYCDQLSTVIFKDWNTHLKTVHGMDCRSACRYCTGTFRWKYGDVRKRLDVAQHRLDCLQKFINRQAVNQGTSTFAVAPQLVDMSSSHILQQAPVPEEIPAPEENPAPAEMDNSHDRLLDMEIQSVERQLRQLDEDSEHESWYSGMENESEENSDDLSVSSVSTVQSENRIGSTIQVMMQDIVQGIREQQRIRELEFHACEQQFHEREQQFYTREQQFHELEQQFYIREQQFYTREQKFIEREQQFYTREQQFLEREQLFHEREQQLQSDVKIWTDRCMPLNCTQETMLHEANPQDLMLEEGITRMLEAKADMEEMVGQELQLAGDQTNVQERIQRLERALQAVITTRADWIQMQKSR